ncbi:hypothetical protein [Xanthocytophaga flava]|uniref:hypothetical protein n=1 Tax=Xanthocytophaga flava TaxID=3048013 RepID=UPI0028D8A8FB|nr:hypothetical protein [Xanthocytophaga flavus]MDJ1473555.1 hypothetical protein [Xanthocytophaga flavus]
MSNKPNHSRWETGQGQAQPLQYRKCTNAVCDNQDSDISQSFGWHCGRPPVAPTRFGLLQTLFAPFRAIHANA